MQPRSESFHPERTEHLHGLFPLRLAGLLKNAQLRGHAHEDAVQDRVVKRRGVRLRDIRDFFRQLPPGIRPQLLAVYQNLAADWL